MCSLGLFIGVASVASGGNRHSLNTRARDYLTGRLVCGGRLRGRAGGPVTVRQRIAIEIWSNYHDYICARLKFADPTPDKQRANEDEAVTNAAEQELHAQRYAIQAYLHRTHQPLELGV